MTGEGRWRERFTSCACSSPAAPASSARTTSATLLADAYPAFAGRRGHRLRQAHLRRQPREPRAGRRQPALHASSTATSASPPTSTPRCPATTCVVNFAAETHVDRSITGAADFVETNVLGAQQVFEAALRHDVDRVVHVSTDEVYGSIDEGSWTEDHLLEPNSPYSAAKAGSRPDRPRLRRELRPQRLDHPLLEQLRPVPLPGEGHPAVRHQPARRAEGAALRRRAPTSATGCYVDDHCRGIQLVVEKGAAGRVLQHRRRPRAVQPGADRAAARCDRARLVATSTQIVDPRGGGHDLRYSVDYTKTGRARLRAAGRASRTGLAATVAVVPRQPRLVGAAQGAGRARAHREGLTCAGWSPARAGSWAPT